MSRLKKRIVNACLLGFWSASFSAHAVTYQLNLSECRAYCATITKAGLEIVERNLPPAVARLADYDPATNKGYLVRIFLQSRNDAQTGGAINSVVTLLLEFDGGKSGRLVSFSNSYGTAMSESEIEHALRSSVRSIAR